MGKERSLLAEMSIFLLLIFGLTVAWTFWGPGRVIGTELLSFLTGRVREGSIWYHDSLDGIAKLLAPLITLATGSYAFYKWYAYSESQLQFRLSNFLKREDERLSGARPALRSTIERPGSSTSFQSPVFLSPALERAVTELGWGSYFRPPQLSYAEYQLDKSILQLEKQLEIWKTRQIYFSEQLSTAHLLKGAMLAGRASAAQLAGRNDRAELAAASNHFDAALHLRNDDLDALEYASHIRVQLGQFPEAQIKLDSLLAATADQAKSLPRARGLRYQSHILMNVAQPQRKRAKKLLKEPLVVLPNLHGEEWIEEAEIHECLGRAQLALRATNKAKAEFEIAKAIFEQIKTAEANKGAARVSELLEQLHNRGIQQDVDDDDEDDDDDLPTAQPEAVH
jgi:tetratricopeptide (TPR) repeat protein